MKNLLIVIIFLMTIPLFSNPYEAALKYLSEDNLDDARRNFKSAVEQGIEKEKATLYYVLLKEIQKPDPAESYQMMKDNVQNWEYMFTALTSYFYGRSMVNDHEDFFELLEDDLEIIKYPELKNTVLEMLALYSKTTAEYDDWVEYKNMIQNIYDWQLVGVFENTSGSGFDQDNGPLNNPKADAVFKNKYKANVNWFNANRFGPGEWFRFDYFFDISNSIIFAQSFVNSPVERSVQVRLGVSGSVKVWMNDQLVFKEKEERNNGQDNYIFEAKLNKGWNRILLQSGASGNSRSNFFIRLTDDHGSKFADLKYDSEYHDYKKSSGEKINVITNPYLKYLEKLVEKEPNELIYQLLYYKAYLFRDNEEKANEIRKKIHELLPNSLFLHILDFEYYLVTENQTHLTKTREKLTKYLDKYPAPLSYKWDQEVENKNIKKMEEILDQMMRYPDYFSKEYILQREIDLEAQKENYQIVIEKCIEGHDDYPNNITFVQLLHIIYLDGMNDSRRAIEVLDNYLDNNFNHDVTVALAKTYMSKGDSDTGIDILKDYIELLPWSTGVYEKIADFYYAEQEYEESIEYLKKAIELAPYYFPYRKALGKVYQQNGNIDKAKHEFSNAIYYYPLDYDSRKQIATLNGDKDLFDKMGSPDLDSMYMNNKYETDEDITVIYDEVQSIAYKNGGFEQKFYMLIKTNNSQGIDMIKEFGIPGYRNQSYYVEKAFVLKPDGSQVKAEQSGSMLVFPSLEVGDAVKIVYKLWTYNGYTLTNHFWDDFYMNGAYPKLYAKYTLAAEDDKKFKYEIINNENDEPKKSTIDNFTLYTWELKDSPGLTPESYMPTTKDVAKVLYISSIPNWDYVVEWYQGLTKNKIESHNSTKDLVKKLVNSDDSDMEKARKIYNYIVNDIRYSSVNFRQSGYIPQKSKKLIDEKLGDCKDVSTLFVNLCNEIGLDANLVLVNTRSNGLKDMPLPSINFDHCIAQLNVDGKKYYVESTSEFLPFTAISARMMDQLVLPIKDGSKELLNMQSNNRPRNASYRYSELKFTDSQLITERRTVKTGGVAASLRSNYRYKTEKERFNEMEEAVVDDDPSLKLEELIFKTGIDDDIDSVTYTYRYTQPPTFIEVSDMMIFEIDWPDKFQNLNIVAQSERKYPIELYKYTGTELEYEEMKIQFPPNTKLNETPKDVQISNELCEYTLKFKMEGERLVCTRQFEMKKDIVAPEEFAKFKKGLEAIAKADKTNIIFKKI